MTRSEEEKLETHFLKCVFTEAEVLAFGRELAKLTEEANDTKAAKAAATAQYGGVLKRLEGEIELLGRKVRTGAEHRNVECRVLNYEPRRKSKTLMRIDTGEIFETQMTDKDFQLAMKLDGSL